jgi:hypothetical protein
MPVKIWKLGAPGGRRNREERSDADGERLRLAKVKLG